MARRRKGAVPAIEWIGAGIGLLIVLGTIGYLTFETFSGHAKEAILGVTVMSIREHAGSFAVDVEVRNAGRGAAADVHVAGSSRASDGREARAQARLDYVPGLSTRRATLIFPFDPGAHPDVRVSGYAKP